MKTTKDEIELLRHHANVVSNRDQGALILSVLDDLDEALADLAKERERAERAEGRCAKLEASVSTQTVATFPVPALGVMCASCGDMGVLYEMHILASRLLVEAIEADDKTKIVDAVARLKDVERQREAAQSTASVIAALRAELAKECERAEKGAAAMAAGYESQITSAGG